MVTRHELKQRLDYDEFQFLRHGVKRATSQRAGGAHQIVRGAIRTPSGDRIPARVTLYPARPTAAYSHVGEVQIPPAWLDEFQDEMGRFFFRSEEGEYFSQMQVLEELHEPGDDSVTALKGRIILMRDRMVATPPPVVIKRAHAPAQSAAI